MMQYWYYWYIKSLLLIHLMNLLIPVQSGILILTILPVDTFHYSDDLYDIAVWLVRYGNLDGDMRYLLLLYIIPSSLLLIPVQVISKMSWWCNHLCWNSYSFYLSLLLLIQYITGCEVPAFLIQYSLTYWRYTVETVCCIIDWLCSMTSDLYLI